MLSCHRQPDIFYSIPSTRSRYRSSESCSWTFCCNWLLFTHLPCTGGTRLGAGLPNQPGTKNEQSSLCLLLTITELAGLKHAHLAFWPKCSVPPRESVASVATAKQSCAAHLAEAPTEISLGGRKTIITFSRDLVETWTKAQQEAWIGRDRVIRFLEAKVDRNWVWESWREKSGSRV